MIKDMKKCLLIYNPHAGKGKIQTELTSIIDTFTEHGYLVTALPTQRSKQATKIIKESAKDYDLVVVSGGDGTLTEGISGMCKVPVEQRPLFGYIPAGTTNDVARSLGISKNMSVAALQIAEGRPHSMDVGRLDEMYFTYVAAFGACTEVTYATPQKLKKAFGHSAYVLETMKALMDMKSIEAHIELDNGTIIDEIILLGLVSSSTSVAGIEGLTGEGVSMDDGIFELTILPSFRNGFEGDLEIFKAPMAQENFSHVLLRTYKVRKVVFDFAEPQDWTIDGEFAGSRKHVEIEVLPHHLQLVY